VLATNPETGHTTGETVTAVITGTGEKILIDITVDTSNGDHNQTATITATDKHPIWVTNHHQPGTWTDAIPKSGHLSSYVRTIDV
jgi:hypothetical protein